MSSCVVGAKPVQLVPGVYTGTCISHEVAPSFRGSIKLKMAFRGGSDSDQPIRIGFLLHNSVSAPTAFI